MGTSTLIGTITRMLSEPWKVFGGLLVLIYAVRASLLTLWVGPLESVLTLGGYAMLTIYCLFIVAGNKRWTIYGFWLIALTLPGVLISEDFFQSFTKWAGWVALFILVGPFCQSKQARKLRMSMWYSILWVFVIISLVSFVWYLLGLPNYGRGAFTGVVVHSMILGPIAAIACLFLTYRATLSDSRIFLFLVFPIILPCLLAGSRSALLGLGVGLFFIVGLSIWRKGFSNSIPMIFILISFASLGFLFQEQVKNSNHFYRYTLALQEKSLNNSRDGLWAARLSEFMDSPIVGIGVGMGKVVAGKKTWDGVVVDKSGKVNVEPGSSYLAVLSMTGIFGSIGLLLMFLGLYRGVTSRGVLKNYNIEIFEVLTICTFFAVHMIAEGYIFAVGSIFSLLFWLCCGRIYDIYCVYSKINMSKQFPSRRNFMV